MSNPWLKKNPFLSMWLSGAHAVAGSARGRITAEIHRQAKAATSAAVKEAVAASPVTAKSVKRPAKTRKRR